LNRLHTFTIFGLVLATCLPIGFCPSSIGREPSQIQNPDGPPPTGPVTTGFLQQPGNNPFAGLNTSGGQNGAMPGMGAPAGGSIPGMGGGPGGAMGGAGMGGGSPANAMIQQILSTRIPTGTVLTGTLSDDISSHKSQVGDLFSIVLSDGYFLNGFEVIPRNARIVGTVVSVAHAGSGGGMGMPGNVSIGLTTLVFPDGRSMPFGGMLDHNPAAIQTKPPKVVGAGFGLGSYGQQISSMFGSFGGNMGYLRANRNRGPEFQIKSGTMVPVRLNRTLDLTKLVAPTLPPGATASGPIAPGAVGPSGGSAPGTASGGMPGGQAADPTALQFPNTKAGQPVLPRELPEPF